MAENLYSVDSLQRIEWDEESSAGWPMPETVLEDDLATYLGVLVMDSHWRLFGELYIDLKRNYPERVLRMTMAFTQLHPEIIRKQSH